MLCCAVKRCEPAVLSDVDIGTGAEQQVNNSFAVSGYGRMERLITQVISRNCVNVSAGGDQGGTRLCLPKVRCKMKWGPSIVTARSGISSVRFESRRDHGNVTDRRC